MLTNIIKQFNWIDIFVVIFLIRISYIAIKLGFVTEVFKLSGVILATYLSLHYYTGLSTALSSRVGLNKILPQYLSFFCFFILAILGYLIFVFLRRFFLRFIKLEPVEKLNKWGGFILGITRAILLVSLIIFIFLISNIDYLKNSIKDSYSEKFLFKVAPTTYTRLYNSIVSKFMPQENFNQAVLEVQKNLE